MKLTTTKDTKQIREEIEKGNFEYDIDSIKDAFFYVVNSIFDDPGEDLNKIFQEILFGAAPLYQDWNFISSVFIELIRAKNVNWCQINLILLFGIEAIFLEDTEKAPSQSLVGLIPIIEDNPKLRSFRRNHFDYLKGKIKSSANVSDLLPYLIVGSKNPIFELAFAYQIRQTPKRQIKEFLDYQSFEYGEGFIEFLERLSKKQRNLLSKNDIEIIFSWIHYGNNKSKPKVTELPLINHGEQIKGLLSDSEIKTFFSHVFGEKLGTSKPFLSSHDLEKLLVEGLIFKTRPPQDRLKLNMDGQKSKKFIRWAFYHLYTRHRRKHHTKRFYAQYLMNTFKNFEEDSLDTISNGMRSYQELENLIDPSSFFKKE